MLTSPDRRAVITFDTAPSCIALYLGSRALMSASARKCSMLANTGSKSLPAVRVGFCRRNCSSVRTPRSSASNASARSSNLVDAMSLSVERHAAHQRRPLTLRNCCLVRQEPPSGAAACWAATCSPVVPVSMEPATFRAQKRHRHYLDDRDDTTVHDNRTVLPLADRFFRQFIKKRISSHHAQDGYVACFGDPDFQHDRTRNTLSRCRNWQRRPYHRSGLDIQQNGSRFDRRCRHA